MCIRKLYVLILSLGLTFCVGCASSSAPAVPVADHAGLKPAEALAAYQSWTHITDRMQEILDIAGQIYSNGSGKDALDTVNVAYFQYYEMLGVERNVMRISGRTARVTEYEFANLRKLINAESEEALVLEKIALIKGQLEEQGTMLDERFPRRSENDIDMRFADGPPPKPGRK